MSPLKSPDEVLSDVIAFSEPMEDRQGSEIVAQADDVTWKILVVDDDPEVHAVTRFVLAQTEILGRPLKLIEAQSVSDAQRELLRHPDIAVILLDVVMEEHDSGLRFAQWVRSAGLDDIRIILRTGQPGYAPELDVIRDYDINDYRAKSELTQTRLITSLTTALRVFQQMQASERTWRGLEMILSSCGRLSQDRNLASFSLGVLLQVASLCGCHGDGLVCEANPLQGPDDARIVAGVGATAAHVGSRLGDVPDAVTLKATVSRALADNASSFEGPLVLTVGGASAWRFVVALDHRGPLDRIDTAMLRLFAANISAGFENARQSDNRVRMAV